MNSFIAALAGAVLVALGRRVAGGLVADLTGRDTGDWSVRGFLAVMAGLATLGGPAPAWAAAAAVLSVLAGSAVGNLAAIGMTRPLRDTAALVAVGWFHVAALAAVLLVTGAGPAWPLAAASVGYGLAYPLAYALPHPVLTRLGRGFGGGTYTAAFADPPQLAELLAGAALGAGLALA